MRRFHAEYDEQDWPLVVTQLPVYNEYNVVERAMRALAAIEYPRDRHIIQVLDDSTDETRDIIDQTADELREQGHRVEVVRREQRVGFKAGALDFGMQQVKADYFAIFDADFVPQPDFLRRTEPLLMMNPDVGLVQARWGHLNPGENMLTRLQAISLDGHFAVEQPARAWSGCFMNFNGTAGVWRRQAIEEAGGWEHDTLTEDMDLSYRSQMAGWKPYFLHDYAVPAEIPADMNAFKSQQFRWAKGSMQTAIKLLPSVMRSKASRLAKVQAAFHMTHYLTHVLLLMMIILALPVLLFTPFRDEPVLLWLFISIVVTGTMTPVSLYIVSQRTLYIKEERAPQRMIPLVTLVGIGMALEVARAVCDAVRGRVTEFVRTPKQGDRTLCHYVADRNYGAWAELGIGLYCYISLFFYLHAAKAIVTPFLCLYATGFTLVGILSLRDTRATRKVAQSPLHALKEDVTPVA